MKKYIVYIVYTSLLFIFGGCDVLDKYPLDKPNQDTFWNNASEINGGVVGCYRFLIAQPNVEYLFPIAPDLMTDIGFPRQESDWKKVAQGQHDSNLHSIREVWHYAYQGVGRCNLMLEIIEKKSAVLSPEQYKQYKGECLFLRGFYYSRLISFFGDVPLILKPIESESEASKFVRESKDVVLQQILKDFTDAATLLEEQYVDPLCLGRATRGTANAYKARIALYNKKWEVAAEAAEAVISSEIYKLYPKYGDLFLVSGLTDANNKEIILKAEFSAEIPLYHKLPLHMQSRNLNGYSTMVPTQNLIDSYHCIDGKNIAESPLFNKKKPFENRDPRLRLGFVVPGDRYGDFIFESHVDSTSCWSYAENGKVTNKDCYSFSPYTSYTGYCTRKFSDPSYADKNEKGDYPLILCRYAEVLLTYAEAKIEANDIDKSVVDATDDEIKKYIKLVDIENGIYEIIWTIEGCEATGCNSNDKWQNVIDRIQDKMLPSAINFYHYYKNDEILESQYKDLLYLVCEGIIKYAKDNCNQEDDAINYINKVLEKNQIQLIDKSLMEGFLR